MKYKLTVVITDTTTFKHLGEPVTHRTVCFELTDAQSQLLKLTPDEYLATAILEIKDGSN